MLLKDLGIVSAIQPIVFVGKPEPSGKMTSDGDEYYTWKLKNPITVRCSVDSAIEPQEVEELYIRKTDLDKDVWVTLVEGKPEDGIIVPNWRADFSKGQEIPIFQETTIAQWTKANRGNRREQARQGINERIKARQANKAKNN